jgi:hypothetical protein
LNQISTPIATKATAATRRRGRLRDQRRDALTEDGADQRHRDERRRGAEEDWQRLLVLRDQRQHRELRLIAELTHEDQPKRRYQQPQVHSVLILSSRIR